jgi:hypothetical protein
MSISPPPFQSALSQQTNQNNFIALQSALLAVSGTSAHITFTNIPGTLRVTYTLANTGSNTAYVCGSNSSSIKAAVASSATPSPSTGTNAVSNCHAVPAGSILTLDFIQGTDTISAITSTSTTNLEISIGQGQ